MYVTSRTSILFLMLTVCFCRCKEWSFKGPKMYLPLILPISNYHSLVFQKDSRRYLRNLWTLSVTYNRTMPRRASVTNFKRQQDGKRPRNKEHHPDADTLYSLMIAVPSRPSQVKANPVKSRTSRRGRLKMKFVTFRKRNLEMLCFKLRLSWSSSNPLGNDGIKARNFRSA